MEREFLGEKDGGVGREVREVSPLSFIEGGMPGPMHYSASGSFGPRKRSMHLQVAADIVRNAPPCSPTEAKIPASSLTYPTTLQPRRSRPPRLPMGPSPQRYHRPRRIDHLTQPRRQQKAVTQSRWVGGRKRGTNRLEWTCWRHGSRCCCFSRSRERDHVLI